MSHFLNEKEVRAFQNAFEVYDGFAELAEFFKIFGDGTRLKILFILSRRTVSVESIAAALDMTQSAVSHQLASLRKLNIVKVEKVGKHAFYALRDDHIMEIFTSALEHVEEE